MSKKLLLFWIFFVGLSLIINCNQILVTAPKSAYEVAVTLAGQWQLDLPFIDSWAYVPIQNIIFTKSGDTYSRYNSSLTKVYRGEYWINSFIQPMEIDLIYEDLASSSQPMIKRGIFEFYQDGKLHVEIESAGWYRPTKFSSNGVIFNKIDNINSPDWFSDIQDKRLKAVQREYIAQNYLNTIRHRQQDFFLNQKEFADSLEPMEFTNKSEDNSYRYYVILDKRIWVKIIAEAKFSGLRSYTVFISGNNGASSSFMCETLEPSLTPPAIQQCKQSNYSYP